MYLDSYIYASSDIITFVTQHNKKETGDVLSNMSYMENINDDVVSSDEKSDKPNKMCILMLLKGDQKQYSESIMFLDNANEI